MPLVPPASPRAAELPLDEDRRPDGRAHAQTPCEIHRLTLPRLVVAVHSRWRAALEDAGGEAVAIQWKPCPDRQHGAVGAPAGDRRRRAVAGEDVQYRKVGIEERPDRLSDGREDLAGGRLLRHEYRHLAQRRLLVSESVHLSARLSVGDRSCHELGELVETRLGIRWQRPVVGRPGGDHAPQAPFHQDRNTYDGADADRARSFGERPGRRPLVVNPCRLPRPEHPRGNGITVQMLLRAERKRVSAPRAAYHDRAAIAVEAEHPDLLRAEEPPDLFSDRTEHLRPGNFLRDERRDALKRSLFALAAASLGDVAPDAEHHALLGDGRHRPLDPLV